jgi:hypothetical protein
MLRFIAQWLLPAAMIRHHRYDAPAAGFVGYETLPLVGVIAFIAADGDRVTTW